MARRPGAAFRIGTISASHTVGQRIGPPSSARGLLLRGQARISLDPVAGCWRETRLGGGDGDGGVGWSGTHVQPHLVVADVEAGQMLIPLSLRRISSLAPSYSTARRVFKTCRRGWSAVARAPPSLRQTTPGPFSS